MRKLMCMVLLLSGCGRVEWAGQYAGSIADASSCSDGSGFTSETDVAWVVRETAAGLEIDTGGVCGLVGADADGATAAARSKSCTQSTANGLRRNPTLTSGRLSVTDDTLLVGYEQHTVITGGAQNIECVTRGSGTLRRR